MALQGSTLHPAEVRRTLPILLDEAGSWRARPLVAIVEEGLVR